jgi:hypothetical protein
MGHTHTFIPSPFVAPLCLFCAVAAACALPIAAQEKPAEPPSEIGLIKQTVEISTIEVNEPVLYEKYITKVREEADGTGVRTTHVKARIMEDAGVKQLAVLTFTYSASNQQMEIGAVRVTKPNGSVVITPEYNIQDMPADVSREAPMYSDVHEKHVAVKGLGVGDVLEYETTLRTLKPDVPGHFWLEYSFEKNSIILDEELDLDLPADKAIKINCADLQPAVTTSGNRKHYRWISSNLKRPDPDAPPKSTKHWKPSVQVTTFSSWQQVGEWYASLAKDRLTITPAIQAKADELTKGLKTNDEKIHAIFNDVALHIHYVGLDFGIGRYQPHAADDVLSNEYGDCKDKHTLLAALLKAEGIEAWPTLISSSRPLDADTPSPAQFDHVITMVSLNGKLTWMDSTAEVVPVGMLLANLRDKQALAIPAGKPAYLERTPADLPFQQQNNFHAEGKLSNKGVFTGHIGQKFTGDSSSIMRIVVRAIPQSRWKEFAEGVANRTGFAGEVSNPQFSPVEKIEEPFTMDYDYTREKFGEWDNHRISSPLPPMGNELAPGVKVIKPADDIDLGSPGEAYFTASVELPAGWLLYPPGPTDVVNDWAEYHSKYVFENGKFTSERRLVIKKDKVPLADWEKWLDFRRAVFADEVKMAPLNDPNASEDAYLRNYGDGEGPAWLKELGDCVQKLRELAAILIADPPPSAAGAKDTAGPARKAIEAIETKTKALPASEVQSVYSGVQLANAWCMRGWLALAANDLPAAESDLRSSWKLGADRQSGYLLGRLLEAKGEKAAAAHQYELAHIASSNPRFVLVDDTSLDAKIAASFKKLTGKDFSNSALNRNRYEGSLLSEFDKLHEIKPIFRVTKLTGIGYYSLAFETGTPVKVVFLGGDKGMERLTPQLEAYRFGVQLPTGSKARLLRELRAVCTPYAGCDAYLITPASPETPPIKINGTRVISLPIPPPPSKGDTPAVIQLQQQ